MRVLYGIFRRDLIGMARGGHAATAIILLLLIVTLLPLGLGADLPLLRRLSGGLVWLALLLAALLSLERLFQEDYEDGCLDQYILLAPPLESIVLAKCAAHGLGVALPLIAATPLAALLLNQNIEMLAGLIASLLLGAPALIMLGALGAAVAVVARRGGLLVALLVLPLQIPLLIFGAHVASGDALPILALLSLASILLVPLAIAAILRSAVAA